MPGVHLGLIVPLDELSATHRDRYMADINRLLDTVSGQYESAWCIDHLNGDELEGWTALAYLAALHRELVWGHTVLCQSFRNPALLAKMAATLQLATGGRIVLGIGAGWLAEEYEAYGYPFPSAGTRVHELDEALRIITAMWKQDQVTFAGRHHRVMDARCEPKPNPLPPIMVGAFGAKMLRLTARHADWWNVSSTSIEDYRGMAMELERACDEIDRDPATVRRTWSGGCVCAPTEADVAKLRAARDARGEEFAYDPEDFVGTPSELVARMQPFIELGVDCFMLDCGGFPSLTTVETLIDAVLPAING